MTDITLARINRLQDDVDDIRGKLTEIVSRLSVFETLMIQNTNIERRLDRIERRLDLNS